MKNKYIILAIILLTETILPTKIYAQINLLEKSCTECHKKTNAKKYIHQPSKESCFKCHQSNGKQHPSENDEEGFRLIEKVPQLCYKCHENKHEQSTVHKPVKDGDCLSCHPVHSADEVHLTSIAPPKQCYFCHTDLKESISKSSVVHGAINNKVSCLICHDSHATEEKKLLVKEEKSLCFTCHDRPVVNKNRTIPNMKQLIEKSKYMHGAIDNNGCAVCHNPHATNSSNLLKDAYPSGNYAQGKNENYKNCFISCHESSLIEEAVSKETGFRNGSKNLHFLHVTKNKGRSCNNCHNVHASNNLFLLADQVKFGLWDMPLRFKRIEKGGTCSPGCHGEKSYVR